MKSAAHLLLVFAIALPAAAQTLSVEERLAKLEQEVVSLREENAKLRKELGLETPAKHPVVKAAGSQKLQLGGYLQGQMEGGEQVDSRFAEDDRAYLRRARLNVGGRLVEDVDFKVEFDLSGSLGATSGMRAQITDAYFNWTRYKRASVRFGQFKSPFGFEQLYSDVRLLTPERSLASDRLTQGRQLGLQLGGELAGKRLSYAIGMFNGNGTNTSANDDDRFMTAARIGSRLFADEHASWDVAVNGFTSEDEAVSLGGDFGFDLTPATPAHDNLFRGERSGIGFDTQVALGRFDFWGEYLRTGFEPQNAVPFDEFESNGWYAQGGYMLLPGRLQGIVRYEAFDPSSELRHDDTRAWTIGTTWLLRGNDLKLQLNYVLSDFQEEDRGRVIARVQTAF